MKRLIVVGGTMGVGKTAVCGRLLESLPACVWLDGDWCWKMHPFVVNAENREMVLGNIAYLLRSFLQNSGYRSVLFCWVLHEREILDELLRRIGPMEYELHTVFLTCTEEALRARLKRDVAAGLREPEVVERSVRRLPLYAQLGMPTLDVSGISAQEAVRQICEGLESGRFRQR